MISYIDYTPPETPVAVIGGSVLPLGDEAIHLIAESIMKLSSGRA